MPGRGLVIDQDDIIDRPREDQIGLDPDGNAVNLELIESLQLKIELVHALQIAPQLTRSEMDGYRADFAAAGFELLGCRVPVVPGR
jgi:hypothetical protein